MRWKGDPTRGDLELWWSTKVGMRVPQSIPLKRFMNLFFFSLKIEHCFFTMQTYSYQGGITSLSKGKGSGTTYYKETIGVTEEGNIYCIKGRGSGGLKYKIMSLGQSPTSSLEEFKAIFSV